MMTDWKPMCVWMMIVAHRIASEIGLRVPAAKGATVNGIKAADINLNVLGQSLQASDQHRSALPLKSPVIASMSRRRLGDGCWVVGGAINDLYSMRLDS